MTHPISDHVTGVHTKRFGVNGRYQPICLCGWMGGEYAFASHANDEAMVHVTNKARVIKQRALAGIQVAVETAWPSGNRWLSFTDGTGQRYLVSLEQEHVDSLAASIDKLKEGK